MLSCYHCGFETSLKQILFEHMKKHASKSYMHTQSQSICKKGKNLSQSVDKGEDGLGLFHPNNDKLYNKKPKRCRHCNAEFKYESWLMRHIASRHCDYYKITDKKDLNKEHLGLAPIYWDHICRHCGATFTVEMLLHDHIVKKHPAHMGTVTSKIHECTNCTYKTTRKYLLTRHVCRHLKSSLAPKRFTCIVCNKKFRFKDSLNNHTIKVHPNLVPSSSAKTYECTKCPYKDICKQDFNQHMSVHGIVFSNNSRTCIQCGQTFISRSTLDCHILKKHPNFIATITSTIYECIECSMKTPYKHQYKLHLRKHAEPTFDHDDSMACLHCQDEFETRRALAEHIIKDHPNFIASVKHKIYECIYCTYKTTYNGNFNEHVAIHEKNNFSAASVAFDKKQFSISGVLYIVQCINRLWPVCIDVRQVDSDLSP